MDATPLIKLLDDYDEKNSDDDEKKLNDLLKRCLNESNSDLNEFIIKLSNSFDNYLPKLQTFTSYLCNKYLQFSPNAKLERNILLAKFISRLITNVIKENLQKFDLLGFSELLHNCVELLWWAGIKENNKPNSIINTIKIIFSAIMGANILDVLISEIYGYYCLKRLLFDFNMINQIEQTELLKAVDIVADLLVKCPEHINDLSLSKGFSVYKACTALLRTLSNYQGVEQVLLVNRKNSLPPTFKVDDKGKHWNRRRAVSNNSLTVEDEQHLALLGMKMPQKPPDLPHFLRALEQQKIDSFKDLVEFFPCISCHKQALIHFYPEKYYSFEDESAPSRCFHLPFEFNEDDKLGPWDILLSEDTIKDLQHLESRPDVIKSIMQKLGQMSSGKWDEHEFQRIAMRTIVETQPRVHSIIPIYEIVLSNSGLKILWQVDYGFTIRSNSLTQLIRIWAITDNKEQIDKVLDDLIIVHQVYTLKQRNWCIRRMVEVNLTLPMILGDGEDTGSSEDRVYSSRTEEELLMVHKMLVTNKFVPLSTNLYKSLVFGGLKFTFQVSKKEYEIINYPTSAIVIGRSGTGKTTCIVFRQIASYLNSQLYKSPSLCDNNINFYKRQIFITMSSKLRYHVKKYFNRLRESAELAGKKMTKREFREYNEKKERGEYVPTLTMHEEKDEEKELNQIPNTFNYMQLTDKYFPLFITFEKFFKMLQGTYGIKNQDLIIQEKLNADNIDSYDKEKERFNCWSSINTTDDTQDKNFVSYNRFRKKYWPSLNDYCNQKFDCELVYSEFSIIKGTNPDVDFLSREDYIDVSIKKYPVFCYNRDQIYDLFLHYEKMKKRNHEYDSMDRTLAIFRYAKKKSLGSLHIHEVYIDECQDNHIVSLALILKVFNRASSVFFAGDIAQCIAKGSSFRFQDLQALMYQWELTRKHNNILKPKIFELNVNYRSHNGILKLAASVVKLIERFFPNSIDQLPPERSEVDGPQPIIIDGFQEKYFNTFMSNRSDEPTFTYDICREMKCRKRRKQNSFVEFGADQVIIVRDEVVKARVIKLVGKGAMVLTVLEAKGMEFNDVLLYNFFTDSPACRKWRVILSAVRKNSEHVPAFSYEKHYILSSELKNLYVAVTRARRNIWICDTNTEYSKPIREYWERWKEDLKESREKIREAEDRKTNQKLVRVEILSNLAEVKTYFSNLAKKSSSDEWNIKGIDYFEQRNYGQAIFCFIKSGNEESRRLSYAYYLRQIARDSKDDSNDSVIKLNFTSAAEAFKECSRPTEAALCYQEINMYEEAGEIYAEQGMFEPAAYNYRKAKKYLKAGRYFEKVEMYDDAAFAYNESHLYEIAANFILRCKQQIESKTFRQVARHIKDDYHSNAISYGKYDEAIYMYERLIDDNNGDDISETLEFILYICRIDMLKETIIGITNHNTLQKYLIKAKEFIMEFESRLTSKSKKWSNLIEEFNLYSAYLDKDVDKVYKCIRFFRRYKEIATEFHAINIWLQILTQSSDIQDKLHYERLLCLQRICVLAFPYIKTISNKNSDQNFEDIFCIRKVSNLQKRQIPSGNPLQSYFVNDMHKSKIENVEEKRNDQHIYDVNDVHERILKCLIPHIFEHIQIADQKGRDIPDISYQICYKFTSCEESVCQRHHVIPTPSILHQRLILVRLQYTVMINVNELENLHSEQIKELENRRFNNDKQIKELGEQIKELEKLCLNVKQISSLANFRIQIKTLKDHLPIINERIKKLENHRLLVNEQIKTFYSLQKWWAERLVNIHIRYQSPQISCPEITHMVLANFPEYTRKIFIDYARKTWLVDSKNVNNFEVILKCMFILQRLQGRHGIDKLTLEMTKTKNILHPKDLPIGFEYYNGHNKAIPVGNRLSSFFFQLYLNNVKSAISNIIIFTQYAIDNTQLVNIVTFDAFNDLVSLIEFTTSLIFTIKPGYCDFCIPRGFLVNYFEAFTVEPLIPNNRHNHDRKYYLDMIKNSFEQAQQLLNLLIYEEHVYLSIILRLIRLLILICLNEPNYATKINIFFKYLYHRVFSTKIKKYLEKKSLEQLINVLCSDLNETGCDSLVIVHHNCVKRAQVLSKFSNVEKNGIKKLTYRSIKDFHSALQQIKSPVNIQEKVAIENSLQVWYSEIRNLPQSQQAIGKIQGWFRRVHKRAKSRQPGYDPTPNKIYNDMMAFCKKIAKFSKEINKESVGIYNILLRGQTVDVIVRLIRLKAFINNCSPDLNESKRLLELKNELREHHYKKVEESLKSLSITENSAKHKEINIEWLKNELQQAEDIIDQFQKWVDKYEVEVNASHINKISQKKEF
ncbi:hypothetical protein RclHR1_00230013 [Rhizophagus clarus]|uniref:UvrD-like helicase ATP-binding domain-containing protein n=1 Tax=Rhizophagus clarus TaxID=94130 RepID=A0A2Z6QX62_9GLOM|nr:hypothetical protein RclHR1_00230013 [Rhizophagus clarus]GES72919.1 hypothetical protein RCL_jg15568.t1 [Rhizophagus clarus]